MEVVYKQLQTENERFYSFTCVDCWQYMPLNVVYDLIKMISDSQFIWLLNVMFIFYIREKSKSLLSVSVQTVYTKPHFYTYWN